MAAWPASGQKAGMYRGSMAEQFVIQLFTWYFDWSGPCLVHPYRQENKIICAKRAVYDN